jgi:hypothetical protein
MSTRLAKTTVADIGILTSTMFGIEFYGRHIYMNLKGCAIDKWYLNRQNPAPACAFMSGHSNGMIAAGSESDKM